MSDWGQSSAIEQTNNLISEGLTNARATREHNRSVINNYNSTISAINNKTDAVGIKQKTADEGEEAVSGIQTAVAVGQEAKKAYQMGVGNYLKSQPGQIAENLKGAVQAGKDAFGIGTSPARTLRQGAFPLSLGQDAENLRSLAPAGEDLGFKSSIIQKGLQTITDLPDKQIAGLAKGLGAFTGIAGAGFDALEDISAGSFGGDKDASSISKTADKASLVAGGLDAMALAVPILAPVAGVADLVSGGLAIGADLADTKSAKDKAKTTEQSNMEQGTSNVVSQGSAGQVATSSTQSRSY
jgi:hypothetical protein